MSQKPLVSIVTLAYNHGRYIRQCLDGFVMQVTDFPFEVIIHDDASTDDTAEILREYEQKYPDIIKPIYQKENQYSKGIPIGATYLYPKAQGKYIAECEGDDWWTDSSKLQKQVDFLEAHPEYQMCTTSYSSVRMKDGHINKGGEPGDGRDITFRQLMKKNVIGTLTVMYRRDILLRYQNEVVPNMPAFRMGDIPFWLFIASQGKIRELPYDMANYRVLENSVSHSRDFDRQYRFFIEGSRVRLWMNRFLGTHYRFLIWTRLLFDTRNFCRRWARNNGEKKRDVWRKARKILKSTHW